MNILAIGDVVGSIGCQFLRERLPAIKKQYGIDLVIANGENSADGNGILPTSARHLYDSGVHVITTGNHSFRRRESYELYEEDETMDQLLKTPDLPSIVLVDFHAEATGEKRAMGYFLDGRVSAVFGTHTHVPTADECILPKGTGYITYLGMTGPVQSVLGVKPEIIIEKLRTKMPVRHELAGGECRMDCCLFEIDEKTGRTTGIQRMQIL